MKHRNEAPKFTLLFGMVYRLHRHRFHTRTVFRCPTLLLTICGPLNGWTFLFYILWIYTVIGVDNYALLS